MNGRQKVVLVTLAVLLVAFFTLAVGVGSGEQGRADEPPGVVERLGRLAGGSGTVDPATVRADCDRSGDVLSFLGDCELRVADPGGLKTVVLRSARAFEVTAPAPRDADLTVHAEVEPGDGTEAVARIAVDRAATVLLSCPGGAGCTVTVAAD
ncbi:hypothetical protein M8C17_06905 [Micromonospora sp. RHAY321]|uniref:hypothetical protein n=1 Tax=Micromonospora sp. RHAY321 TaxID=2944807 RepID=UPI00207C11B4|nr:hypothetical protein [Micromonospora sp. RHAY321]MCO1594894.1 hypothetical protein [Micromonospora sp. RHAY321]